MGRNWMPMQGRLWLLGAQMQRKVLENRERRAHMQHPVQRKAGRNRKTPKYGTSIILIALMREFSGIEHELGGNPNSCGP